LFPDYRVNRHDIQRYLGEKTAFNLNDFRQFCGSNKAGKFIAARLIPKWGLDEVKAEKREAQRQWRAEYLKQWFDTHPNYLPNWERAHLESRKKRNRRYYLKKKLRDGIIPQHKYDEEMRKLELIN